MAQKQFSFTKLAGSYMHLAGRAAVCTTVCSLLTGCVALVPWVKPDAQARGDMQKVCPISGFTPGIPGPDGDAAVARFVPPAPVSMAAAKQARAQTKAQLRIRALMGQLNHEQAAVRTNAASDIGAYGPNAHVAVAVLADAVQNDDSEWVRRAAVKSLAKIGTPDVVAPLRLALNDRNKWVAHSASNALRKLGYSNSPGSRGRLAPPVQGDVQVRAMPAVITARGNQIQKY